MMFIMSYKHHQNDVHVLKILDFLEYPLYNSCYREMKKIKKRSC